MPKTKKDAPTDPPKRVKPDWDAIEAAHRTGRYSDGQLAQLHRVSREAIVRRRKRDQAADPKRWLKDLGEQVRQTTQALLAADAVTRESQADHIKVTDVIVMSAEAAKTVVLRHRQDIVSARTLTMHLLEEIRAATLGQAGIEEMFQMLTAEMDPVALALARQRFNDFLRLHARVGSMHKLADTLSKLQASERKAFSLDEPGEKPRDPPPSLTDIPPGTEDIAYREWVRG